LFPAAVPERQEKIVEVGDKFGSQFSMYNLTIVGRKKKERKKDRQTDRQTESTPKQTVNIAIVFKTFYYQQ
jgi:hypothetical protein